MRSYNFRKSRQDVREPGSHWTAECSSLDSQRESEIEHQYRFEKTCDFLPLLALDLVCRRLRSHLVRVLRRWTILRQRLSGHTYFCARQRNIFGGGNLVSVWTGKLFETADLFALDRTDCGNRNWVGFFAWFFA